MPYPKSAHVLERAILLWIDKKGELQLIKVVHSKNMKRFKENLLCYSFYDKSSWTRLKKEFSHVLKWIGSKFGQLRYIGILYLTNLARVSFCAIILLKGKLWKPFHSKFHNNNYHALKSIKRNFMVLLKHL